MVHINRVEEILQSQFLMHLNQILKFFAVDFYIHRADLGKNENIIIEVLGEPINLFNKSFHLYTNNRHYRIWYYDKLNPIDLPEDNSIPITIPIKTSYDINTIATKTAEAILGTGDFIVSVIDNVLTIFVKNLGDVPNAIDEDSGFNISVKDGMDSEYGKYYELYGVAAQTEHKPSFIPIKGVFVSDNFQVIGVSDIGTMDEGYFYTNDNDYEIKLGDKIQYMRNDETIRSWVVVYREALGNTRVVQYRYRLSSISEEESDLL